MYLSFDNVVYLVVCVLVVGFPVWKETTTIALMNTKEIEMMQDKSFIMIGIVRDCLLS